MKAEEFYASFTRLFDYLLNQPQHPDHPDNMFQDKGSWTRFMLHDLLPRVVNDIGKDSLEWRYELQNIDLCAWHNSGEEWDQVRYGRPLYVHLMIEHENGLHPQEEFWKLLHLYARLKVLVCYCYPPQHNKWPQRDEYLEWLKQMHDRASAFHPRSKNDAYLVIIGQRDVSSESCFIATPAELAWQGYKAGPERQGFEQIS